MYKLLNEVIDPNMIRLTNTQQAVLLSALVATTPELAYEQLIGNLYTKTSSDFLHRAGLVNIGEGIATVTGEGFEYLLSVGLCTESGEVTELGQSTIDAYHAEIDRVNESKIPFRTLKVII